jgi:hypothetical protein
MISTQVKKKNMEGSSCELSQGCTNPEGLVMQEPKFFMVAPNIFSIITAVALPPPFLHTYKNVVQFTCPKQSAR